MHQYEMARAAIAEKAQSERLFLQYALALATLLVLAGIVLVVLGVGDHLDIIVQGRGDIEARFINATPGVVLWLLGGALFAFGKPRRLKANASHGQSPTSRTTEVPAQQFLTEPHEVAEWESRRGVLRAYGRSPDSGVMVRLSRGKFGPILCDGPTFVELPEGTEPQDVTPTIASALLRERRANIEAKVEWSSLIKSFGKCEDSDHPVILRKNSRGYYVTDGTRLIEIPQTQERFISREFALALLQMKRIDEARELGRLPSNVVRVLGKSPKTCNPILLCRGAVGEYRPYITDGIAFSELPASRQMATITYSDAVILLTAQHNEPAPAQEPPGEANVLYQTAGDMRLHPTVEEMDAAKEFLVSEQASATRKTDAIDDPSE